MFKYLIKKISICLFSMFIIMSATFFLMKLIPGDPLMQEQEMPKEVMTALYKYYGLDQPLYIQYFKAIKGFFTLDFGPSMIYEGRTVNQIIKEGFPITLTLGLEALTLSLFLGISLGSFAALKKNQWQDSFSMIVAIIGISLPNFLFATLLQYIFAIKLNLFPIARWGSFAHSILPALSLAALPTAFIARLMRSSMAEVLKQDYIKTAYAKGLSTYSVICRHALRNAILPVISYLGPITAKFLTEVFVIEKIFGIPGIGQWLILSISNRDYTVIMGLTVFFSFILISVIFIVDIIYRLIDPRIEKAYGRTRKY